MKELKLNLIQTVNREMSLQPLQKAADNKRVKMMTWQSMNWINTMRRMQVEFFFIFNLYFLFFFLLVDFFNMCITTSTCVLLVSL